MGPVAPAPPAPWALHGELFAALPKGGDAPSLGDLTRIGRRSLVVGARITDGPIGAFHLLAVLVPAHLGLRIGLTALAVVVDTPAARVGVREHWGLPAELGSLRWDDDADRRRLIWREAQTTVVVESAGSKGRSVAGPLRLLQRRTDGLVVIGGSLRGRVRRADVDVVAADGPFAPLAGAHRGVWIGGLETVVARARRPVALAFSQRAPGTAPEPALAGCGPMHRPMYDASSPRAISSVG